MATIGEMLFESPLYLYLLLGVAELALAALWHERRTRRCAAWLAAPLLLAGGVFLLERLVVTDREQIVAVLRGVADEVEAAGENPGDLPALAEALDADVRVDLPTGYGGVDLTRPQVLDAARGILGTTRITSVRYVNLRIDVTAPSAISRFSTVLEYESPHYGRARTALIWTLHWRSRPEGWRIVRAERPQSGVEL